MAYTSMSLASRPRDPRRLPSLSSIALSLSAFPALTSVGVSAKRLTSPRVVCCPGSSRSAVVVAVSNGRPDGERREIRLGLPSKGRMSDDTLGLLKDCRLSVKRVNPRQYVAKIPQLSNLQVWFQRPKDIVRQLLSGDLDIGIVGFDTVSEYGQGNEDLIIVHDALGYGDCHLSLAIPKYGIFEKINSVKELAQMPQWTAEKPLRVATGFTYLGPKFMKETNLKHMSFLSGEGALEAAPAVMANMRGSSAEEITKRVLSQPSLSGLQGPTISPVFCKRDGEVVADYYAIVISVPKKALYSTLQQLRAIGGSGVLPVTYIFDGETPRWQQLPSRLGPWSSVASAQAD